jgi:hypothetical protein
MLHEVVAGLGRGLRKTAAKAMSDDYNYYQPEKKSLEFTSLLPQLPDVWLQPVVPHLQWRWLRSLQT